MGSLSVGGLSVGGGRLGAVLTQYYTAATLDGFIATTDHSLAWLFGREIAEDGPMGYAGFFAGVGALCMGASTYAWVTEHHDGPWPYDVPCWVFTHRTFPQPEGDVRFTAAPVPRVHAEMVAAAAGRNVWVVGGGGLVAQFHEEGLLDEVWVQYAPVTIGAGAPLLPGHAELRLEELARNGDFACARYAVVPDGDRSA